MNRSISVSAVALSLFASTAFAAEALILNETPTQPPAAAEAVPRPAEDAAAALARENALLQEKLKALQEGSISSTELARKNCKRLKEMAADVRQQRQAMADFEGYVKWMSAHVAEYSKYLSAGSVAAGFAKVLPIPYAGQASVFTKFVSRAAVSLGDASVSIKKYLGTSQQFLARVDVLDKQKDVSQKEISELVRFADQELLKGMIEVQERLATTSQLSASSLSFLESLNHYVGSTDEYWAKTKALLKSGDDQQEKGFLAERATSLKDKAQVFNSKLKLFDETVRKDTPVIKSLVAYDDLIREIDPKLARVN